MRAPSPLYSLELKAMLQTPLEGALIAALVGVASRPPPSTPAELQEMLQTEMLQTPLEGYWEYHYKSRWEH